MNNKTLAGIVAGVIVVVAVGAYALSRKHQQPGSSQAPSNQQLTAAQIASTTPVSATPTTTPPANKSVSSNTKAYDNAIEIYGTSGYRFQFSQCHGTPGKLAIKKGSKFMLDNRDSQAHTIVVKSQTFHVPALGFAIVTARDLGTYNIICDGGGAAQLTVEE